MAAAAQLAPSSGGAPAQAAVAPAQAVAAGGLQQREVVKLFVGQIPKTLEEEGVRDVFKEFGEIVEVVILRDRRTGMHQGCCFVKYASLPAAQAAIQALHNQRSLPPLRNPLQVRFADSGGAAAERGGHTNAENKLFVGGVPVGCGDKELRTLFSNYGEVQDVYILASKSMEAQRGCAFVRYASPNSCSVAIEALHGKYAMKAGELPLVVRFADPPKSQRGGAGAYGGRFPGGNWPGGPQMWAGGGPPGWPPMPWGMGAMPASQDGYKSGPGMMPPWMIPPGMQPPGMQPGYGYGGGPPGYGGGGGAPPLPPGAEQQMAPPPPQQQQQQQPPPPPMPTAAPATSGGWSEHQTPAGFKYYYHTATGTSSWEPPAEMGGAPTPPPQQPASSTGAQQSAVVSGPPGSAAPSAMGGGVTQLTSSVAAMSMGGAPMPAGQGGGGAAHAAAAPPSAAGPKSGSFEGIGGGAYANSYAAAANSAGGALGGGGLGGLGMPTGGVSLDGVGGGLGNGSGLPGLSQLGGAAEAFGSEPGSTVLVRDLPDHFSSQELTTAFAQFGKIVFCELGEGNSGRVGYENARDASSAVATMNGLPVGEKMLHVSVVGLQY